MIKLPRLKIKQRIIRNLVIVLLLLFLCSVVEKFASFTPKAAFRRLEKAYLSGPSEILAIIENPDSNYGKIVLATYPDYIQVGTIGRNYHLWKGSRLLSYKSHGDITVIPYGNLGLYKTAMFVVTNTKESVRAEMTINFEYTDRNENKVTNIFTYEGMREAEGVYFFQIENQKEKPKFEWERDRNLEHLIETLGWIADIRPNADENYPIQLRFYSEAGELIKEENIEFNTNYLYGK